MATTIAMSLQFVICFLSILLVKNEAITTPPPPTCNPFVYYPNGTNSGVSIGKYLDILPCASDVSRQLKEMFRDTPTGVSARDNVIENLGNLCFGFVAMVSTIDSSGHINEICDDSTLGELKLSLELCPMLTHISEEHTVVIENLNMLGFYGIAKKLQTLIEMDMDECQKKCDNDYNGRALCNAYYHTAILLSQIMTPKIKGNVTTPPLKATPQIQMEVYNLIVNLTTTLLPLTKDVLYGIMATVQSDAVNKGNLLERHLTTDIYERVMALPNISTILRMLWVAKMAPPSMGEYSDEKLKTLKDPKIFLIFVPFADKHDRETVESFQDLGAIMEYIRIFKKVLFPSEDVKTTSPGQLSNAGVYDLEGTPTVPMPVTDVPVDVDDTSPDSDKRTGNGSDSISPTEEATEEDIKAVHKGKAEKNDTSPIEAAINGTSPTREAITSPPEVTVKEGEEDTSKESDLPDREYSIPDNGFEDDDFFDGSEFPEENPDILHGGGDGEGEDTGILHKGGAGVVLTATKASIDKEPEPKSGGFGAYHVLILFMVFGGIAVTSYLCMHNRKKVREGVGAYLTNASKQRRTRNYKPLATVDA